MPTLAVQMTTAAAPWWGVPLIAGLFAIGGVLATLTATHLRERKQDKRRWEKDLREVAAEFYAASYEVAVNIGAQSDAAIRMAAKDELTKKQGELRILAPGPVVELSRQVWETATAIERKYRPASDLSQLPEDPLLPEFRRQTSEFVAAVRQALHQDSAGPRRTWGRS